MKNIPFICVVRLFANVLAIRKLACNVLQRIGCCTTQKIQLCTRRCNHIFILYVPCYISHIYTYVIIYPKKCRVYRRICTRVFAGYDDVNERRCNINLESLYKDYVVFTSCELHIYIYCSLRNYIYTEYSVWKKNSLKIQT